MVGSIGEDEPEVAITLRSSKGQITLRRRPNSGAAGTTTTRPAPAPPEEPLPTMDPTLAVLEALARGDISVDEADELLSGQPRPQH